MHDSLNEFTPASQGELQRFVRENDAGERRALYPVGGRAALNFGYPATRPGVQVSLGKLAQTVDYPSRDMTITVEAGVRMDDLARQLREAGQQLPVDVPQSNRATLGGVVATNAAGPRRFGLGTMRDYVIGISAVDAAGRLFHSGGRVVKNVAGYDLCKLLVGSLGSLAIITQLTLKLRPLSESRAMLWAPFETFEAIDAALGDLLTSAARPVVLDVLNPQAARQIAAEARQELPAESPVLVIGVEGSARETVWQVDTLKTELARHRPRDIVVQASRLPPVENKQPAAETAAPHAAAGETPAPQKHAAGMPAPQMPDVAEDERATRLLQAMTEFQTASDDPVTFQAALLPSQTLAFVQRATSLGVAVQSHAASGIVFGHLPDKAASIERVAEILSPLRAMARQGRGNLVVVNCDPEWAADLAVLGEPEPGWPLMHKLKRELDPHDVLNPGRFAFAATA